MADTGFLSQLALLIGKERLVSGDGAFQLAFVNQQVEVYIRAIPLAIVHPSLAAGLCTSAGGRVHPSLSAGHCTSAGGTILSFNKADHSSWCDVQAGTKAVAAAQVYLRAAWYIGAQSCVLGWVAGLSL